MGRYSKFNSSYILRKQHQTIDGGVIIERDWVTIGERHNIGPGKKRVSYDGNFLFTENTESMAYRKAATGRWVGSYNYNDVKDASDTVNKVKLNTTTDDPLVFAYYGSLYDKFEGAIINILKYFPGNIKFGNDEYSPILDGYRLPNNLSLLKNEFEINFISTPKNLTKYDNEMRYMSLSWQNYNIIVDENEDNPLTITKYTVENKQTNIWDVKRVYIGEGELFKYNGKYYKYDESTGQFIDINIVESDNYFVKCNEYIKHKDEYYKWSDDENMYKKLPIEKVCEPEVYEMFEVTLYSNEEKFKIHIYRIYDDIIYTNEIVDHKIEIRPKKDIIDAYFDGLSGIEAIMLNRRRNHNYSFEMLVCETDSENNVLRTKKTLSWPKDNNSYCITISGIDFDVFADNVLSSAENYDMYFTDNIWRNMTHESIKNYDWSYERNGNENEMLDNEIGSNVVCNILRLIGMEFDELKMYIEGITNSNKLTYNGFLNMPDSEVVNALEMSGFDTFSTIWHQDEYVEIPESEIPENVFPNNYFTIPNPESILDDYISVGCVGSNNGIKFYKRKSTIGDEIRLDYAFFNPEHEDEYRILKKDPWISRNYSGYSYRKLLFQPSDVASDYWTERNTYDTPPTVGSRFSPRYARVYTTNGFDYYEKVSYFDNLEYIHNNWFDKLDPNYFSQSVVDIDFMRRLGLSSRNIFATKGTAHGIDMIMAVFGFGRENDNNLSDYELIEPYHDLKPIPFNDDFYYYEPMDGPQPGITYGPNSTFAVLPLHATSDNYRFPEDIKVDDGFGGYYYFKKTVKKTYEVVNEIYNSIINVSNEDSEYPGFPLATMFINGKKYFIPYMSDRYDYHGELYFQSKGGWCKKSNLNSGKYDYTETVPYIKSVNTPDNLLDENALYNVGDYVYVKYPLNNVEAFNINPAHVSNYFKLVKQDVTNPESWRNIPLSGPIEFDNYLPVNDDDAFAPTHNDYINAKFIDEIIFTNVGNNPHSGNGKYDGGVDYLSYMRLPFKYSIDNANSDFTDNVKLAMAKQFAFDISNFKYYMPKVFNNKYTYVYEQLEEEPNVDEDYWNSTNTLSTLPEAIYPSTPEIIRVYGENNTFVYFKKTKLGEETIKYFLNSKIVIMKNLNNNVLYKRYFNSIILPYLLQVVPSTTIFVLENFNECDENNGCYYDVEVISGGDGCGIVTGGGRYFECDYATLTAVPGENCHFVEWQQIDCESGTIIPSDMDMTKQTIMPKIVGAECNPITPEKICYVAIFEYNCIIKITNCLNKCDSYTYSNDISYGTVLFNGDREFRYGTEYVVDDEIQSYFLISNPLNGYYSNGWIILDENNVDITSDLGPDIISISENRLDVFDRDKLCGCTCVPVFSPMEFNVSADILCECGESRIEMSEPEICDPVYVTFSCCEESACCDTAYVKYIVGWGGIRTKYFNDFDTPIVLNRNERLSVEFFNEAMCCNFDSMIVNETTFHSNPIDIVIDNDTNICVNFISENVELKYDVTCCEDHVDVIGFLDANDVSIVYEDFCPCGTDVIFAVSKIDCIPYFFTVNGNKITNIKSDSYKVYIRIDNVNENINVTTGVDFDKLQPIWSTPVFKENGVDIEITETCYEYSFIKDCSPCEEVCFNYNFTDDGCDCSCKYETRTARFQYSMDKIKWKELSQCLGFDEYISLIHDNSCQPIYVRAFLVREPIELTINVSGSYPSDLQFICEYDGNTITLNPSQSTYFSYQDNEVLSVTPNYLQTCGGISNLSVIGCKKNESLNPDGTSTVNSPCGNVVFDYTFSGYGQHNVTVMIYDEETDAPTTYNCVSLMCGSSESTSFDTTVECGEDFYCQIMADFNGCCESITRIMDSTPTSLSYLPATNLEINVINITENHEIRVYVKHKTYTVQMYYKIYEGSTCSNRIIPKDCLKILCNGGEFYGEIIDLEDNFLGYKWGYTCCTEPSFTEVHTCIPQNEMCCNFNYYVKHYEWGLKTNFDSYRQIWSGNHDESENLEDIIFSDVCNGDDYVIVIVYDCERRDFIPPEEEFMIIPIDEQFNIISGRQNCLSYGYDVIPSSASPATIDCSFGVNLHAETDDCYTFKRWMLKQDDEYKELSRDAEYQFFACEDRKIYAQFSVHSGIQTVTAELVVLEQDFSAFNPEMHDQYVYNNVIPEPNRQTITGSCGEISEVFTFVNNRPDLFSFLCVCSYDSFTHAYIPCTNIDVVLENINDTEVYSFEVKTCKTVDYKVILVPNDYVCFYNCDYIDEPMKNIAFSLGYYDLNEDLIQITQGSSQAEMLPEIK